MRPLVALLTAAAKVLALRLLRVLAAAVATASAALRQMRRLMLRLRAALTVFRRTCCRPHRCRRRRSLLSRPVSRHKLQRSSP